MESLPIFNYSGDDLFRAYADDITTITVLVVVFTIVRYSFQSVVQNFVETQHIVDKTKSKKFSESAWKFLFYATAWTWGASITLPQDFFWNPSLCIENWPNVDPIPNDMRWFYLVQFSFYIHGFICHITIEVKRKDYFQMLFHHVISAALISASYVMNVYRFGAILLILHDINDIILEGGKMFIYSGYQKIADGLFALLIVCWFTTRIVMYPMKVIYTATISTLGIIYTYQLFKFYFVVNAMLLAIQGLNIMWFGMMLRLLFRVILNKGGVKDSREEEQDEDD